MVLRAEHQFSALKEVASVRWHPTLHLLAVARVDATAGNDNLHIFEFNPITHALTEKDTAETNRNIFALAWRKTVLMSGDFALAVGRSPSGSQLVVYPVDATGTIGAAIDTANTSGAIQAEALDWDKSGNYIAVGVEQTGSNKALQVWEFSDAGSLLTLNASAEVPSTPGNASTRKTVLGVGWNKKIGKY